MGQEEQGLRVSYIGRPCKRKKEERERKREGRRGGGRKSPSYYSQGMAITVFSIERGKSDALQLTRSFLPRIWMSCPVKIRSPHGLSNVQLIPLLLLANNLH